MYNRILQADSSELILQPLKWIELKFSPLEVVRRYRDSQLQAGEND